MAAVLVAKLNTLAGLVAVGDAGVTCALQVTSDHLGQIADNLGEVRSI